MIGPDPMTAMYAAAERIADGQVAEIELTYSEDAPDGTMMRFEVVIRREVRPMVVARISADDDEDGSSS